MPKLLLIDNYDSFTFNLAQAFQILGAEVEVHRNDRIDVETADGLAPTHLCISPGPGRPEDAGVSMKMIEHFQQIRTLRMKSAIVESRMLCAIIPKLPRLSKLPSEAKIPKSNTFTFVFFC